MDRSIWTKLIEKRYSLKNIAFCILKEYINKNMFINYGKRRLNLSTIREYSPIDNGNYIIEIIFVDGKKENINFFSDKEKRDEFLKKLDSQLT